MGSHFRSFIINAIAGSSFIPVKVRVWLYRSQGFKLGSNIVIGPYNYFFANNIEIGNNSFISNHVLFQNGAGNAKIKIVVILRLLLMCCLKQVPIKLVRK